MLQILLILLQKRWNVLEREGRRLVPGDTVEPEFYTWFVCEKSEIIHTKMLWNVRIAAQLGDPPAKFYTNPIESTIIFSNSKFFHHLLTVPS